MSAKGKTTIQDEVDKMFDAPATGSGDDLDDLLNEVVEDDAEAWVPSEPGEGIAGIVVKVGETRSDFAAAGEDPMVPTVTIETKNGDRFRVIGYGAVLRRELMDANPRVGDKIAVKYFGEKPIKKGRFAGKLYRHFGVAIRRSQDTSGQSLGEVMAK